MGNFNLKNIWAPKAGGGGSIPSNLEQRVQELENNTLKLNNNQQLQIVHHGVDFYENIICKKEAFVDVVGNGNTNITNKQYVDTKDAQNVKLTGDQSIAGVKTFTGNTSFNNQVAINSGAQDFTWDSTRNWNQNVDNTVARTKDFKYVRIFEKTNATTVNDTWNTELSWTVSNINTDGLHEFLIIVSIDNVAYSLNGKIVWKNGLGESKSQYLIISNGASECYFQLVIKGADNFRIYHKKTGSAVSLQWIRGWIVRAGNQPWKMNQLW